MGSEAEIAAIEETPDEAATDGERAKLTAAKEACATLRERIAAVADETRRLTDGVNGFDVDRVTSDDKAQIEELIAGIDALLGGDNLTDGERAALEALKDTAQTLIDRIAAAKAAAESDEIRAVDGIGKDNVKREDKDALIAAKKAAEDALRDFDGNYTDEEREALKETLDTVQAALDAIGNAEKAAEEIDRLPAADEVGPDDKDGIDRVKKIVDGLTENERAMLGDAAGKPDALIEKIRALADSKNDTPKTGEMSDLALWFALLFVSGGAFAGIRLAGKKKTEAAGHSPGSGWPGKRKPKSDHWRDGRTKSGCPALAPGSERPEKDRRSAEQGLRLALSYVILIISGRSASKRTTGSATERLLPTLISGVSAGVPIRRDRMEERR